MQLVVNGLSDTTSNSRTDRVLATLLTALFNNLCLPNRLVRYVAEVDVCMRRRKVKVVISYQSD